MFTLSKIYATEDDIKRFEDIKRLYIQARSHSKTKRKQEQKTRHNRSIFATYDCIGRHSRKFSIKIIRETT